MVSSGHLGTGVGAHGYLGLLEDRCVDAEGLEHLGPCDGDQPLSWGMSCPAESTLSHVGERAEISGYRSSALDTRNVFWVL